MTDYVPDSITEIIISYGAQALELNDELAEIGSIILMEGNKNAEIEDSEIREYITLGAELVREILEAEVSTRK